MIGRRAWIPSEEIVTGERLQSLTSATVLPLHVRDFHRNVERYAPRHVLVADHRALDDRAIERLSAARSLFVYTHELEPFVEHVWPRLSGSGYVLMTHNSDYEVGVAQLPFVEEAGEKLAAWFAQNLLVRHPKLHPLPIGIANSMWPHGHLRRLRRAIAQAPAVSRTELVHAQFNPATHPDRQRTWDTLRASFPAMGSTPPPSKSFSGYLADLARHRFCVCPRGNGIDSHRVWECLYLGVVPIVARSTHTELWAERGVPMLLVDDWAEVTPDFLEAQPDRPPAREPLLLSSYASAICAQEAAASEWVEPAR